MVRKNKSSLIHFFSNPVVGIIGSLASVAGILLGIYFYLDSKTVPDLMYFVQPARAVLVQSGRPGRLTHTLNRDTLRTDVTAVQIAFWNNGKQTIKRENLLKPFVLIMENGEPILEAVVRKTSRDVVGIVLQQDSLSRGRLTVSWNILERNDGGVIQFIYSGRPDAAIHAEGVIEGQTKIKKLEYPKEIKSTFDQTLSELKSDRLFQLKMLTVCMVGIIFYIILSSIFSRKRIYWYWEFFMMTAFVVQVLIWIFILSQPTGPPFGF